MLQDVLFAVLLFPALGMLVAAILARSLQLPWLLALGFAAVMASSSYYLRGKVGLSMQDGLWLLPLLAVPALLLSKGRWLLLAAPLVAYLLMQSFASSVPASAWLWQSAILLLPLILLLLDRDQDDFDNWLARSPYLWLLAPAAMLAPVIAIGGSTKLGLLSGAIAVAMLVVLLMAPRAKQMLKLQLIAVVWMLLCAYHLVELPLSALLLCLFPLLVFLALRLVSSKPLVIWLLGVVLSIAGFAYAMQAIWPSSSLY